MPTENKQEIIKINVTSKEQLDELYKSSALTFTGVSSYDESLNQMLNWIKDKSEISNPIKIHIIKGNIMNNNYELTGNNAYKDNLTLISIKTEDIKILRQLLYQDLKLVAGGLMIL